MINLTNEHDIIDELNRVKNEMEYYIESSDKSFQSSKSVNSELYSMLIITFERYIKLTNMHLKFLSEGYINQEDEFSLNSCKTTPMNFHERIEYLKLRPCKYQSVEQIKSMFIEQKKKYSSLVVRLNNNNIY